MVKASASLIKELKKQKKENRFLLFLDNIKIINDAIAHGLTPKYILVCDEKLNKWGDTYPVYKVDKSTIEQLSDTKTPQGVVCIADYIQNTVKAPNGNFLVMDEIQDPGNAGSLIRTACACGFNDIYMLSSVAVTNPKLVRSSVGTIFDVNIYELNRKDFITLAQKHKLSLVKADMDGENIFTAQFKDSVGVVIGNEGQGVSDEIGAICTRTVKIPMHKVESLNAGISGSIIMYEIAKPTFN